MIKTKSFTQNIPKAFIDKMNVDSAVDQMKESKIVNFFDWNRIRKLQSELRDVCISKLKHTDVRGSA